MRVKQNETFLKATENIRSNKLPVCSLNANLFWVLLLPLLLFREERETRSALNTGDDLSGVKTGT